MTPDSGLFLPGVATLIQLIGLPRSGTTLLAQVVGKHSDILTLSEPFLMYLDNGFFRWSDKAGKVRTTLSNPGKLIKRFLKERPGKYLAFKETWRDPSSDYYPNSEFLLQNWQRGIKTIAIVRDPRAVWYSSLNRYSDGVSQMPDDTFLQSWCRFGRMIRESGMPYVRYEDLVLHPGEALARVFGSIGFDEYPSDLNLPVMTGYGDEKAQSGGVISDASLTKYRRLDAAVLARIESSCSDFMREFGYSDLAVKMRT